MSDQAPNGKIVRIGCASGFWGDSEMSAPQLVLSGQIDYLVFDYLAEITMSLLARARDKNPEFGFAPDFVNGPMRKLAREIKDRGIRVVSNAGGVNASACRAALERVAAEAGVDFKIAVVEGDDLLDRADEFRAAGVTEMFSGDAMPAQLMSMNAYLGARPIADALDAGADIVITGRGVDSAVTLGPLMYEFGWTDDDYDRLAAGSLAGHIVECGAQGTGGLFTDWESVPDWENIGYPIVECVADGSFTVTKPEGTGGLVTPATVGEQVLYEIGDPANYLLPDVNCDWTQLSLEQAGENRVAVSGAQGKMPSNSFKVSATYPDGFRAMTTLMIGGIDAGRKAKRVGEAILNRVQSMLAATNLGEFRDTSIEVIGAEGTYGNNARVASRDVVLKLAVHHDDRQAVELFSREIAPSATSFAPGITGFYAGRPRPTPVVRLFSCMAPKDQVPVTVDVAGDRRMVTIAEGSDAPVDTLDAQVPATAATNTVAAWEAAPMPDTVTVPLIALAHGRSGDKGNHANIGIISRRREFLPLLRMTLSPSAVAAWFSHVLETPDASQVQRFELPGMEAFNFLLLNALGGGGIASLRYDPQGKAYAQMMLDMPVQAPADWFKPGGLLQDWQAAA
jgi:hypothetical protein